MTGEKGKDPGAFVEHQMAHELACLPFIIGTGLLKEVVTVCINVQQIVPPLASRGVQGPLPCLTATGPGLPLANGMLVNKTQGEALTVLRGLTT